MAVSPLGAARLRRRLTVEEAAARARMEIDQVKSLEENCMYRFGSNADALAAALKHAPGKTKTQVINEALRDFARRRRLRGLLKFRGRARWEGDLDSLRERNGTR